MWHKFDYGFNPHISLYDGKSRSFAENLVKILNSHLVDFDFTVDRLSMLKSLKGQTDYRLILESNLNYINENINRELNIREIEKMDENQRLVIINEITKHLTKAINTKKKQSIKKPIYEEEPSGFFINIFNEESKKVSLHELLNFKNFDLNILRK